MEIKIVKGDDLNYVLTVLDSSGVAQDLTGATAAVFTVKDEYTDENALIQKTLGSGVTLTDAANVVVTVVLTDSDTDINAGLYKFDLQITDASGNIVTVRNSDGTPGDFIVLNSLN